MTSGKSRGPCSRDSSQCFLVFLNGVEDGSPLHRFVTEKYTPAARTCGVAGGDEVWIE